MTNSEIFDVIQKLRQDIDQLAEQVDASIKEPEKFTWQGNTTVEWLDQAVSCLRKANLSL